MNGKGSKRRPGNTKAFRENWNRAFGSGPRSSVSGTYVLRDGKLVPGHVRKNDAVNIRSLAAGVIPDQVPEATQRVKEAGLKGVKYDTVTGDVIFRDRRAKLGFMKHSGLVDRDEVRG